MLRPSWPFVQVVLVVALAYIVGQVAAIPSKACIEVLIAHKLLGPPSINLVADNAPPIRSFFFPEYFEPLPTGTRKQVLEKARQDGCSGVGEELFLFIRFNPDIASNTAVIDRLNAFINQYGMHRNMCFTFLLIGLIATIDLTFILRTPDKVTTTIAVVSFVLALGLLYRFLKFYRQYSYEIFNIYGQFKI